MTYQIVIVSNRWPQEWYYLHREFFSSLKGHPVTLIDYTKSGKEWKGLATKPKWLYDALCQGAVTSKYMIFADCWDLVFTTDPEEIIDVFSCFQSDIVISAERNCFPDDLKPQYDKLNSNSPHQTPYKYLNSGFIVGRTDAIKTCLEAMDLPNMKDDYYNETIGRSIHSNDQFEWQKIFLQQPVHIELDEQQLLSQTLHDVSVDEFDFSKERIRNKVTGSYPCAVHFNGGAKDNNSLRNSILGHLNLV